jgi:hypothetical protein
LEIVRESREPITLVIQADEAVTSSRIMQLVILARKAGVKDSIWATRPPISSANQFPLPVK